MLIDDRFFVAGTRVHVFGVRDLVETKVDGFSFREMGEEAPGHDFAAIGPGFVQPLILADGAIMPLERTDGWLA